MSRRNDRRRTAPGRRPARVAGDRARAVGPACACRSRTVVPGWALPRSPRSFRPRPVSPRDRRWPVRVVRRCAVRAPTSGRSGLAEPSRAAASTARSRAGTMFAPARPVPPACEPRPADPAARESSHGRQQDRSAATQGAGSQGQGITGRPCRKERRTGDGTAVPISPPRAVATSSAVPASRSPRAGSPAVPA